MWDLPRPGLEPVSPALAGGFLTTVPPGNPLHFYISISHRQLSYPLVTYFEFYLFILYSLDVPEAYISLGLSENQVFMCFSILLISDLKKMTFSLFSLKNSLYSG